MCGSGVMSCVEEPADGDPQVLLLGPQALGPLGLSLRGPVGVLHERAEVLARAAARRRPASARAARRSAASSRTDASMRNLGPASVASTLTRLCPASASSRSSVRSSVRSETCTAASSVQPSTKTDSVASISLLRVVEQPDAPLDGRAQRALTLGRSTGPVPSASRLTSEPGQQCRRARAAGCGPPPARWRAAGRRGAGRSRRRPSRCPRSGRSRSGRPGLDRRTAARRATTPAPRSAGGSRTRAPSAGRPGTRARRAAAARCGSWRGS